MCKNATTHVIFSCADPSSASGAAGAPATPDTVPLRGKGRPCTGRVVVVEVGLVGEEPVPEELAALDVVGPVRLLGVDEDDPGVGVAGVVIGLYVEITERTLRVAARGLEPGMGVRGVVEDDVDDDANAALMGLVHQVAEVLHGAVARVDLRVVGDVVASIDVYVNFLIYEY